MPHYVKTRAQCFRFSIWNIEPFDPSQYDCATVKTLPTRHVTIENHAPVASTPRFLSPSGADPFQHTLPTFSSLLTCAITAHCFLLDRLCCDSSCCDLFAAALPANTAAAVSDGSYNPVSHQGSWAFILSSLPDSTGSRSRIIGCNLTTGLPSNQSSFCSELAGILGILTSLELFCHFYCINSGSITIFLNGYSALA